MKKIFIFVSVVIGLSLSSYAEDINECKTDIYYGNGVGNSSDQAKESREKLENRIIKLKIIKNNPLLQAKYGKVKLQYNWGQGKLFDVLETYYQLKEAGQLDGVGFFTAIAALTVAQPQITLSAIATQKLTESWIKGWEQGNVDEMWTKYYHHSFKLSHKVLLVSHSQGNLFANRIYKDTINPPEYKEYFANVQVASPANKVEAMHGDHVTLFGDPIINPIPGSMPGNAQGSPGHAFIKAYLEQIDPYTMITNFIKQQLQILDDSTISQWDTDQEFDEKTCDHKITVKHRFDPVVEMPFKVYPFNAPKSLYQVNGKWIKASCGGKHIFDQWSDKKESECWVVDNPQKEMIIVSGDNNQQSDNTDNSNDNNNSATGGGNDGSDNSAIDFNFKTDCTGIEFPDPIPDTFSQQIENLIPEKVTKDMVDQICKEIKDIVDSIPDIPDGVPTGGGVPKIN